ncbi:TPA: hypothetical protein I7776_21150 [Vibrio vulnificus]|nr:hypothetical protein [Vibrio vulnificus]
MKRLTSNSSGLLTLRDFSLNWVSAFKAQWFELGVLRYQPLNWALGALSENLMIITWLHLKVMLLDLILSVDSMDAIYE